MGKCCNHSFLQCKPKMEIIWVFDFLNSRLKANLLLHFGREDYFSFHLSDEDFWTDCSCVALLPVMIAVLDRPNELFCPNRQAQMVFEVNLGVDQSVAFYRKKFPKQKD